MKKITALLMVVLLAATPVFAAPKEKKAPQKADAVDRIGNETADALADVLTGENSKKPAKTSTMPPGLAKKDKTPAGWDKGRKEGWDKAAVAEEDSPIKKFFKNLFKTQ